MIMPDGYSIYLQLHPQVPILRQECDRLRERLAELVLERDQLIGAVIPNLRAIYLDRLGHGQYCVFCAKVQLRRLRRKAELVRAAVNRDQQVSLEQIESRLDEELQLWEMEAQKRLDEIRMAQERLSNLMSPDESADLHTLYRQLVKRLHPDINPELPAPAAGLWQQVVDAYKCGDFQTLRQLALMMDVLPDEPTQQSSLDMLQSQRDRAAKHVAEVESQLAELHGTFPLNLRDNLHDSAWVEDQQAKSSQEFDAVQLQIEATEAVLTELCGGTVNG